MIAPNSQENNLDTIHYGTASCGHVGQIFKTGKCAHCYIAELEANTPGPSHEDKPVAWMIERPKGTGKEQWVDREVVLSPLTDDTFMDEGDCAWPLYKRREATVAGLPSDVMKAVKSAWDSAQKMQLHDGELSLIGRRMLDAATIATGAIGK